MYYQCEDVAFRDILAYYELSTVGCQQFWCNVFGLYFSWPMRWINALIWPEYWDDRVEVADEFCFGAGQGHLLYAQIDAQIQQEEALKAERGALAREIARLQEYSDVFQSRASIQDWTVPGEDRPEFEYRSSNEGYPLGFGDDGYHHFVKKWDEVKQHSDSLKRRDSRLEKQEVHFRVMHPMLEERRGLLAAHLGSERTWMEQQGIAPSSSPATLSEGGRSSRLVGKTGESSEV
jgi:hypothetical protein